MISNNDNNIKLFADLIQSKTRLEFNEKIKTAAKMNFGT